MVLNPILHAALRHDAADTTDGELLERYLGQRDEAAFELLARRHAPMVLAVCRRIVGHSQDAEDAFQATFLVLVRRGAPIRPRAMAGNGLDGVAYRAGHKARTAAARRGARERIMSKLPESATVAEGLWHDLEPLLDLELNRLPAKYRLPIVLCDLEGKTRKETA